MNQAWRLVWSWRYRAFIVAGEHAKSCGASGRALRTVVAAVAAGTTAMALAADLPTGGRVVAGQGSISRSGNTMTITQSSQRMAADGQTFSIGKGNIVAASGGTVALTAAKIVNTGSVTAPEGNVLMGTGSRVTLDLGGPIKIEVTKGAIDALVEQGGAIRADGGLVYLTAHAANALTTTVINHTGVTEAKTLANGKEGRIFLMGDMVNDRIAVGGRLDASAPSGGNGGFIETSAANVRINDDVRITTAATGSGRTGTSLIDPTDFTISDGTAPQTTDGIGSDTLSGALAGTSVTIETQPTGAGNGDEFVRGNITWSTGNTLTLRAHNNIDVGPNVQITAANAGGKVQLEWAQGNSQGDLLLAAGAKINLEAGPNLITKIGSAGAVTHTVIRTLNDLQAVGTSLAGNFALGADNVASTTSTWNANTGFDPIGNLSTPYTGSFNGLGHTVTGLHINRPLVSQVGLFGVARNATLRDIHLVDANVSGNVWVGALLGIGFAAVQIRHASSSGTVSAQNEVGGLVGTMSNFLAFERTNGLILNGRSSATVTSEGSNGTAGGLVGFNLGRIEASSASGSVSGTASESPYVGGLVGESVGDIVRSVATVNVSVPNGSSYTGGLAGRSIGRIEESYATGTVSGGEFTGGLVGINDGAQSRVETSFATGTVAGLNNVGGLVGQNAGMISRSFATGNVTVEGGIAGGLVGTNQAGAFVSVSYATGNVSNTGSGAPIGGLVGVNVGSINSGYVSGQVTGGADLLSVAGGLVGHNAAIATIEDSYATAPVTVGLEGLGGGLVGHNDGTIRRTYAAGRVTAGLNAAGGLVADSAGVVENSYFDSDATGTTWSAAGTPKTTAEMNQATTFAGWDVSGEGHYVATWRIYEGYTRPLLVPLFSKNVDVLPTGTTREANGSNVMQGTFTLAPPPEAFEIPLVFSVPRQLDSDWVRGTHVYTAASPEAGTHAVTMTGVWSNQLEYNLRVLPGSGTITAAAPVTPPATPPVDAPASGPVPVMPAPMSDTSPTSPVPPADARIVTAIGTTSSGNTASPPVVTGTLPVGGVAGPVTVTGSAINALELVDVRVPTGTPSTAGGLFVPGSAPAAPLATTVEPPPSNAFSDATFNSAAGSGSPVHDDSLPAGTGAQGMAQGNPVGVVRVFSVNGGVRVE